MRRSSASSAARAIEYDNAGTVDPGSFYGTLQGLGMKTNVIAVQWDAALEAMYGLPAGTFGGTIDDWIAKAASDVASIATASAAA
jgi:hypothetical protein